jgi:ribosome assembly protein 1
VRAIIGRKSLKSKLILKNSIWSMGPKRTGANILLNHIKKYDKFEEITERLKKKENLDEKEDEDFSVNFAMNKFGDSAIISGFQLAVSNGTMCSEPMMGVCFIIEEFEIDQDFSVDLIGTERGQIMSAVKE